MAGNLKKAPFEAELENFSDDHLSLEE